MSGPDLSTTQSHEALAQPDTGHVQPALVSGQAQPHQHQHPQQPHPGESAPFQSQLEYLSQSQQQVPYNVSQYASQPFDMRAMAGALPQAGQQVISPRPFVNSESSAQIISSSSSHQIPPQAMYTQHQRPHFADPTMFARAAQQSHFIPGAQYGGQGHIQRQQGYPIQHQLQYSPIDPYGFAMNPMPQMNQGYGPQPPFMMPQGMVADLSMFTRRGSAADTSPIPNYPRGPPRKPKQSGHALWVGNLPPAAQVTDLKDHFSRDATTDIESVFLIAKSNCAFVNYKTEAACVAAMSRFHDSRFHGVRLVCRLRRGTAPAAAATPTEEAFESPTPVTPSPAPGLEPVDKQISPTIARSQSGQSVQDVEVPTAIPIITAAPGEKVPEKYFIVKSLTAQDLEASVRNGTWATQSHNEESLNRAYDQAENVYLIFSANKSGEYFGYARMASLISGEPVSLSSIAATEESTPESSVSPQSIPTPATATAPRGRIIDDSARGTIFWEADQSEDDEGSSTKDGPLTGQNWGKQFSIEWMSTNRLPFYRTRGLRNPWNANREVKIARDGTELEPGVGRRLVQMFHRPSPSQSQVPLGASPAGGMPYQ